MARSTGQRNEWTISLLNVEDDNRILEVGSGPGALIYRWMKDNGYQVIGPPRQVRLRYGEHIDPTQYVTEVQFPVAKQGMEVQT